MILLFFFFFFFFNDTATTEIYTLSLHDALPIFGPLLDDGLHVDGVDVGHDPVRTATLDARAGDRKSTRLNSSHPSISYAVFCLKKKKNTKEKMNKKFYSSRITITKNHINITDHK